AGLASAAQRFIPEYGERDDQDGLRGFIAGSRIIGLLVATVVAGAGLLLLWRFGQFVAQPMLMPLVLAAICLPLYVLTDI
ncbi:hypothetical protein ABTE52_22675, partial [Acinetobacter baumannii]